MTMENTHQFDQSVSMRERAKYREYNNPIIPSKRAYDPCTDKNPQCHCKQSSNDSSKCIAFILVLIWRWSKRRAHDDNFYNGEKHSNFSSTSNKMLRNISIANRGTTFSSQAMAEYLLRCPPDVSRYGTCKVAIPLYCRTYHPSHPVHSSIQVSYATLVKNG